MIGLNWGLRPLSISPPSHPLLRRLTLSSLPQWQPHTLCRIIGFFIIYHDDWDVPPPEATPPSPVPGTKDPPLSLQSVRKDIPPQESPPVIIEDVEL